MGITLFLLRKWDILDWDRDSSTKNAIENGNGTKILPRQALQGWDFSSGTTKFSQKLGL